MKVDVYEIERYFQDLFAANNIPIPGELIEYSAKEIYEKTDKGKFWEEFKNNSIDKLSKGQLQAASSLEEVRFVLGKRILNKEESDEMMKLIGLILFL